MSYSFSKILHVSPPYLSTLFDVFTIVELACFLSYFFIISANRVLKRYLPAVFIFFFIFILIDYFFLRKSNSFNSISAGVEAIIIITLCIYYFYEQLKQPDTILVYTHQSFWIIIAFFIFQSGTFFVYLYVENTVQYKSYEILYSTINSSFFIFKNILFSIAMFKKPESDLESGFPEESLMPDWDDIKM